MTTVSRRSIMTGIASIAGLALLTGCDEEDLAGPLTGDPSKTPTEDKPTDEKPTEDPTTEEPTTEQPTTEQSTEDPTTEEPTTEEAPTEEPTTKNKGGGQQKEVPLGIIATDPHVGDRIEIVSAIRHFTDHDYKLLDGAELVLLQVKITPSQQYRGIISGSSFALRGADNRPVKGTTAYDKHIKAAGMKPLGMPSRQNGPTTGWFGVMMYERDTARTYEAAYLRPQSKVIGKNKTLPQYSKKFTIGQ